jgi:hypothetical protein
MIDVSKVSYEVIVITEKSVQLNITQAVEQLGWEEGEDELAMKISFEMYNASYNGSKLSSLIKIGCIAAVKASWGSGKGIVAMGSVVECERTDTKSDAIYNVVAYDNLYSMQKSQDNIYFAKGKGTKSALTSIFSSWGITLSSYTGPNVSHSKILYKNSYLGDIVRGILDEAKKKGGCKAIVRSTENKVSIVAVGSNKTVYHFEGDNSVSSKHKMSITNLVTRVKIVSSEKKEGAPKVEATVDGKTSYGIFQRIVNHASSDSLSDAKKTAQEMIDENGSPEETSTVQAPDVPPVRKGDLVSLKVGALSGFFVILSIQHNADDGKMTMQVKKWKDSDAGSSGSNSSKSETTYTVTANSGLHLRKTANGTIITTMPKGSKVTSDGTTSGSWYHVCYNGTWGYAYSTWLKKG